MTKISDSLDLSFTPIDWDKMPEEPEGGWKEANCSFESHTWTMEIEEGRAVIFCKDPCPDPEKFDPHGRTPTCYCDWQPEDFGTVQPIEVFPHYVDDSTPAGPWGEAEYGFYIELYLSPEDREKR